MEAIQGPIDHLPWEPPRRVAFVRIEVLPVLKGQQLDDRAFALIAAHRPSCLRVVTDPERMQLDQVPWRVTVFLIDGRIFKIGQEVQVGLPKRFQWYSDLEASLKETNEPKNPNH